MQPLSARRWIAAAATSSLLVLGGCQAAGSMAEVPADKAVNAGAATVWDMASRRGVGFRALGQEPGWLVEVDRGTTPAMRVVLDHGQRELLVEHSEELPDGGGFAGATAKGEAVVLRITRVACQDTMSGEAFEATALLHVEGMVLGGCGRFLAAPR